MPRILDGAAISRQIKAEVSVCISELKKRSVQPGLAAVLVGDNPASAIYVKNKVQSCSDLGILSRKLVLPASISTSQLLEEVRILNSDDRIDGILVQLPLPSQVDAWKILNSVDPRKDVDGFHPENVGKLCANTPGLRPCTPLGIMEILKREGIQVQGREAVVVG